MHRQLHRQRVLVVAAHRHVRHAQDRPRLGLLPPVRSLPPALRGDRHRHHHIRLGSGFLHSSLGHSALQVFVRACRGVVHS